MNFQPATRLKTHEVTNQSKLFADHNLFDADPSLRDALGADLPAGDRAHLHGFGGRIGSAEVQDWAEEANRNPPVLHSFDRFGQRLDEVRFHPAYHNLMELGFSEGIAARGWAGAWGHRIHSAMMYLAAAGDVGVCCPMSMTYAGIPVLRQHRSGDPYAQKALTGGYDPRFLPAPDKTALTFGMAMTEKQGGSDVRANTTRAELTADGWRLTGHKWFCSAPMSDAFLTLAQTSNGLTCFLVPRWRHDGADWARNEMHIMRLKDKMGDRSNASSEIEYHGAFAEILGEEGTGIRTIIEMVQHTRLDCAVISAGSMRTTLARAIWHVTHRSAFQRRLVDQPAMRRVLTDLALEAEAATALSLRLARAFDAGEREAAFVRLATPVAKYWICKRQPGFVYEALECFGGVGFVEEHAMARYFRTSPLNAIWEGSGNVIALDILRAVAREPQSLETILEWLRGEAGANPLFARHLERIAKMISAGPGETDARRFAEDLGLALAARALSETAPQDVFDAFCTARLDPDARALGYGAFEGAVAEKVLIDRASVAG